MYVLDKLLLVEYLSEDVSIGMGASSENPYASMKETMGKILFKDGNTADTEQGQVTFDRVSIIVPYDSRMVDANIRVIYEGQKYIINHSQEIGENQIGLKQYLKLNAVRWYERDQ